MGYGYSRAVSRDLKCTSSLIVVSLTNVNFTGLAVKQNKHPCAVRMRKTENLCGKREKIIELHA